MGLDRRDELLLLVAVSGELPADWVGIAVGSESYGAALITRLKKEGMLRQRKKDGLWGYLLSVKAKRYLLARYPEDVERYLMGSSSTNLVKSEPDKRLRLHRMSMVWILCRKAGIGIFTHQKPALPWEMGRATEPGVLWEQSGLGGLLMVLREWKRPEDLEIKGSRACGLLRGNRNYIVYKYHGSSDEMGSENRAESGRTSGSPNKKVWRYSFDRSSLFREGYVHASTAAGERGRNQRESVFSG